MTTINVRQPLPRLAGLSAFALVLLAPAVMADHPLKLAPVVVTGVHQETPLTLVTDPKNPRQPMPASDAGDYLKTLPGFSAIRGGGTNNDPVLRGMFGSRLNLLNNGGEMLGACPSRMDSPSSYIAPETFDRLTVIKGPQSVTWGPGNSAGTILFERDPEIFSEPGQRLDVSAVLGSASRRDLLLDGAIGGPSGYLRLTGNRSRADDYRDGNGDRVPARWDKWNTDLAMGFTPDSDTLVELTLGRGDAEARYAGRGMDGSQFERDSAGLRFTRELGDSGLTGISAQLYYNYADHVMDNYSLRTPPTSGMMAGPRATNVDRRTLGARVSSDWLWDDWALQLGADAQRNRHRTRSGIGEGAYRQLPWLEDATFSQYGVFAEATYSATSARQWIAGARLDRHRVQDSREQTGSGMMVMANPTAGQSRSDTLPSGFVRLEQRLSDSILGYAGIGHVQRFPDYWELFSPRVAPLGETNAFAGIQPERTTQLDVGLQYQQDGRQAWVSAYAGRIDDYILFSYPLAGGMPHQNSRADNVDARIMGIELGAVYPLSQQWTLDGNLAYAWGKNRDTGRPLPQMPPVDAKLGLTWAADNWSAGGLLRGVAGQGRTAVNQGNVVGRDLGDSSGFVVASVHAAWKASDQLRLSTGIDNLFDRAYSEHLNMAGNAGFGFPAEPTRINEPGRTWWVKLDVSL
ncbi:TonB-dependent copper receptor [Halopseudomonas salegens]|uniref:Iron complex outermembrane recepter protein n=1 Tax=Halopseudomonas salegens TaxID=1434072 RepID=A0A1H2HVN1_9GAMM|nr:TonB-dependent copper receptor [Halopseudomonas salegens]SDU35806.1 iron complex outermembrane recepter protein [Halopseudomonas salegens]